MEKNEPTTKSWEELITDRLNNENFASRTCTIYNHQRLISTNRSDKLCPCGRLVRSHSFKDESVQERAQKKNPKWSQPTKDQLKPVHFVRVPVDVFGTLKSTGCKFIRLEHLTDMNVVYDLLVDDCGGKDHKPDLILSVFGGAKYFTMTERLEKEIIRGIIDAATTANAWILTTGVNNGVSKLVGEGMAHHRLLSEDPDEVKCIGLTMWGTTKESTRLELKDATNGYPKELIQPQILDYLQDEKETIEKNHTHCILFDDGQFNEYLGDLQRHELVEQACIDKERTCYAVTIIADGGIGTLEVLENDIKGRRPIVLIQGSGRLADVLASLIEQISHSKLSQQSVPTDEDIRQAFIRYFPNAKELDIHSTPIPKESNTTSVANSEEPKKATIITRIQNILQADNRHLLNVFSLDRDNNVAKTIFKAIFAMKHKKDELAAVNTTNEDIQKRRRDEDRLVDLALQWNYIDGVIPILQSRQDNMTKKGGESIEAEIERYKVLFRMSLIKNRPTFVEYILATGFDPCILIGLQYIKQRQTILSKLYKDTPVHMDKSQAKYVHTLFGELSSKHAGNLDAKLNKLVGSFIGTIYSSQQEYSRERICIDMRNHLCPCCGSSDVDDKPQLKENIELIVQINNKNNETPYSKHELLRDLFLWSVFMDMPEMAEVILVHLQSRICAALIASAIFKRYAKASTTVDHKEKFRNQALQFESYAGKFIDKCYEYNERLGCELLLRQIPLFGDVTCMQVAISSESGKLVGTPCFDQTLSQVWYNKLSIANYQTSTKFLQLVSLLSLGLLAPLIIPYREEETRTKEELLSSDGIECYIDKEDFKGGRWQNYWLQLKYFYQSPMINMCYHFISYIWFLLVFSYMMLYHLDSPDTFTVPHWSEIYVIITVSTMLCEEIRKLHHEYKRRMLERWGSTGSTLLTFSTNMFYILPYFLFYLGLIFRYRGYSDSILTTARIIWAYDLELWYLKSLKFIVALKSVGPKLFMLKNMFRDLAAFIYIIFIAIAAYGVVSRALILYDQIPFTGSDIFRQIFYEPYWFIYGDVTDKDLLDQLILNGTASLVAEATATHVLLALHMLFINILILNLLIAVFTHTIEKVQENTEFYWRYQRYSFVREYFERPPFAYPPLIIIPHIVLAILALRQKFCPKLFHNVVEDANHTSRINSLTRIFKMIPVEKVKQNDRWDAFENAATVSYARSIVEKNKKKSVAITDDIQSKTTMDTIESDVIKPISDQQQMITKLNNEISTMKSVLEDNQKNISEIHTKMRYHAQEVTQSLEWIMDAMARVKMNSSDKKRPNLKLSYDDDETPELDQATTSSAQ